MNAKKFAVRSVTSLVIVLLVGLNWVRPVEGQEEQPWIAPVGSARGVWSFGVPTDYQNRHTGIDFLSPLGTEVLAVADGEVVLIGWWPVGTAPNGHGETLWLYHGESDGRPVYSAYAHLSQYRVAVGDRVDRGEIIALTGQTGAGTGPHLHFAVGRKNPSESGWQFSDWDNPDDYIGESPEVSPGNPGPRNVEVPVDWGRIAPTLLVFGIILFFFWKYQRMKKKVKELEEQQEWRPVKRRFGRFLILGLVCLVTWVAWPSRREILKNSVWLTNGIWLTIVLEYACLTLVQGFSKTLWMWCRKVTDFFYSWITKLTYLYLVILVIVLVGGIWFTPEAPRAQEWERTYPPVPSQEGDAPQWKRVSLTYWNGNLYHFDLPQDKWQDVWDAGLRFGVEPAYVACLGSSESPNFWENTGMHCSLAGACGPYQFMPGTWPSYSPWPGADRTAWPDAPNGASNMVAKLGLDKETTMLGHRGNFTGSDGSLCWNQHVPQADYVWRCTQAVREALGR